jgi:glycine/serine hydroxymethyltransferase
MTHIAGWIDRVLTSKGSEDVARQVKSEVVKLCEKFPMPGPAAAELAAVR